MSGSFLVLMVLAAAPRPDHSGTAELVACMASQAPPAGAESLGAFVEYAPLRRPRTPSGEAMRLFWVEAEYDGARGAWLELWLDKAGRTALRARRAERGLAPVALLKVNRTYFRLASAPPAGEARCGPRDASGTSELVRVPAGVFLATRRRLGGRAGWVEVWTSPRVPVTGLVRLRGDSGGGWELAAAGHGAQSAFPARFEAVPLPAAEALVRSPSPREPTASGAAN